MKTKEYRETILRPKSTKDLVRIREVLSLLVKIFPEFCDEFKEFYSIHLRVAEEVVERNRPDSQWWCPFCGD